MIHRFLSRNGMLLVLLGLCSILSVATIAEHHPTGPAAADRLAVRITTETPAGSTVVIVARNTPDDRAFASKLEDRLAKDGYIIAGRVTGEPSDGGQLLRDLSAKNTRIDAIAVTKDTGDWAIFTGFEQRYPNARHAKILQPPSTYWPTFLQASNLLNISNQIAVIAVMAIGMTMVIIAGGIDLSVGSLLGLSAVICALLIRDYAGGVEASAVGMIVCSSLAILACAAIGLATGVLVTAFRVPPFIITLGVMLIARGLSAKLTEGETVFGMPDSFTLLGRGSFLGTLPNAVVVMLVLYLIGHLLMTRTVMGRYIHAVGGNTEAARLAGVPIGRVVVSVYCIAAALAGLGGVIIASQLQSGSPTYGTSYELFVIAAVVVGGTSLSGGEGTVFGTLIGAFIIAVIQNGMNLLGLQSWDQEIVLGGVIVLAVLFDRVRQYGFGRFV